MESKVNENINLIWKVIHDMKLEDSEDYFQIGCIGLINGLKNFDEEKSKPGTYLYYCIKNEILKEINYWDRQKRKRTNELSLDYIYEVDESGNEHNLMEIIPSDIDIEEEVYTNMQIEKLQYVMKRILDKTEYDYLVYKYGLFGNKELGANKASEKVKRSRQMGWSIERRALNKLRWFYKRYPEDIKILEKKIIIK